MQAQGGGNGAAIPWCIVVFDGRPTPMVAVLQPYHGQASTAATWARQKRTRVVDSASRDIYLLSRWALVGGGGLSSHEACWARGEEGRVSTMLAPARVARLLRKRSSAPLPVSRSSLPWFRREVGDR